MYVSIAWVLGGVSMNERYFPECKYLELKPRKDDTKSWSHPYEYMHVPTSMYYFSHVSGIFRFCTFTIFSRHHFCYDRTTLFILRFQAPLTKSLSWTPKCSLTHWLLHSLTLHKTRTRLGEGETPPASNAWRSDGRTYVGWRRPRGMNFPHINRTERCVCVGVCVCVYSCVVKPFNPSKVTATVTVTVTVTVTNETELDW